MQDVPYLRLSLPTSPEPPREGPPASRPSPQASHGSLQPPHHIPPPPGPQSRPHQPPSSQQGPQQPPSPGLTPAEAHRQAFLYYTPPAALPSQLPAQTTPETTPLGGQRPPRTATQPGQAASIPKWSGKPPR